MNPDCHCPAGAIINTPVHLIERYRGHRLVVRSDDPQSFPQHLTGDLLKQIEYLQLTDFEADPSPLMKWKSVFPLDLMMTVPEREYPHLYTFASLLDRGPVRVSIPVVVGMEKAVKLAASLRFRINIIPERPDADQVMELIRLAEFYLKNPTIEESIEFFHSLFFSMVKGEIATLWDILEKDPARYCHIDDDGQVSTGHPVIKQQEACADCLYRHWCLGFFKYPDPDYDCEVVFRLFDHLLKAAAELKQDLSASSIFPS